MKEEVVTESVQLPIAYLITNFEVLHRSHLRFTKLLENIQQEIDDFFSGEMDKILDYFNKCSDNQTVLDMLYDLNMPYPEKTERIKEIIG